MKSFSVKLSRSLDARLSSYARRRRLPKSKVVRAALEDYLSDGARSRRVTALELAADLVGCLQGPGDLSTNPKYMRDFGK